MKRILFANRSSRFGHWLVITGTILAGCGSPDDKVSPGPSPATVAAASPTSQSSIVKTEVAVPPAIMVRDQNNDPVPGIEVTFAVTQGSGAITGANQTTDANGEASATAWTLGPAPGPNVVTASIAGSGITGNPVTFTATASLPGPASIEAVTATSQTAEVGQAVAAAPSVIVRDANQQPFAGAVVVFAVTTGGGLVTGASQTTDANGRATADSWTLGLVPGSNTLTATVAGAGITGNPVTFGATATAPGPATITPVSPIVQSAPEGLPVPVPPSIVVLDDHRQPVAGANVVFSVTAGGGQLIGGTQTTDASGAATVQSWTLGPATGANTVEAQVTGTGITGNPVIFRATSVPPSDSSIAANSPATQSALEGTAVATPPSVMVRDQNGNQLPGVTVTFAVTSGGGTSTGGTQTTDANGIATAGQWVLGHNLGINTLTASAAGSGFVGNPVTFVATGTAPASVAAISAVTQSGSVAVAVPSPPSVIVKDASQVGVAGVAVTFAVTAGGGSVTGASTTTDAFGVASASSWVLGVSTGQNTLTATVSGAGISGNPVTFNAIGTGSPPANIAAVSVTNQSAEAGAAVPNPPSVIVSDAQHRPVVGVVVVFAIGAGGGSLTGESQTTDSAGKATLTEWTLGSVPGTNRLTATVAGSGVTGNPVTFSATGTAPVPASIAANSPTSQSAIVGTAVRVPPAVTVLDHNKQGVSGVTVDFAVTAGAGSASGATQTTDAHGKATVGSWILGPVLGPNTLTATISGSGIAGNPVTFSATGTAVPDTAVVRFATYWGGSEEDQVRDLATDAQGNIYAVGGTASNDFPTTPGAFDRTHDDSPNGTVKHYDVFVSKFDSTGKLLWSTLLGGPGYDRAYAVEVDAQGFVYIGGRAGVGFPVTAGAAQTVFRGGAVALYGEEDGFVCKLRPDGSAPVFCTYFGTNDFNIVRDIDIDPQGNVYLASSAEADFPAGDTYFNGSYQPQRKAGLDCVVAKLNASGSSFAWATWLGGSGDDGTQPSVRVDGQGNVWYIGGVDSPNMPLVNPTQATIGGGVDDYLAKLSPDGRQLLFATYLGGSGQEGSETHNLAVNRSTGDIYVGSATSSTDLLTTPNALQPGPGGGGRDGLIARYSNAGSLLSLSYVGGSDIDRFEGILVGTDGNVYVSGIGQDIYGTVGPSGPLGNEDATGLVLSPNLGQVLFGIRIGGTDSDNGRAVAPMPGGGFVMAGIASSSDFPTHDAEQAKFGGGSSDGWIGRFIPR